MPRCPRSGEIKPFSEVIKSRASKMGLHAHCKPCHNAQTPERAEKQHGSERQRQRGLGVDDARLAWLLLQQHGQCPICGRRAARHVDHCHVTGRVRALLCFNCNGALGKVVERAHVLHKIADYLEGDGLDERTDVERSVEDTRVRAGLVVHRGPEDAQQRAAP